MRAQTGYPDVYPARGARHVDGGTGGRRNQLRYSPTRTWADLTIHSVRKSTVRAIETGSLIRTIYTMNAPGDAPTVDNPFPQDPYTEVPFEVGDFVSMIGTQLSLIRSRYSHIMSATEVVANLGVFTFPNVDPAYIVVEVLAARHRRHVLIRRSRRKRHAAPGWKA